MCVWWIEMAFENFLEKHLISNFNRAGCPGHLFLWFASTIYPTILVVIKCFIPFLITRPKKNKLVLWFYNFVYRRLCCICFLAISVNFLKASAFWSILFKTFIDNLLASPLFVFRWSRPHKRTTEEIYGITYFEDCFACLNIYVKIVFTLWNFYFA